MSFILSGHAQDVLKERNISEEWMWRTINNPEWENTGSDNNIWKIWGHHTSFY